MADIPAWIGAVGTVATLSTGLVLFGITISDRRRGYASLVAVWSTLDEIEKDEFALKLGSPSGDHVQANLQIDDWSPYLGPYRFSVVIKNSGHQPAYDCSIRVRLDRAAIPPGAYPVIYGDLTMSLGIIAPETQLPPTPLLVGAPTTGHDLREALARSFSFEFAFTDATGNAWIRDQRGRLRRRSPAHQIPTVSDINSGTLVVRHD